MKNTCIIILSLCCVLSCAKKKVKMVEVDILSQKYQVTKPCAKTLKASKDKMDSAYATQFLANLKNEFANLAGFLIALSNPESAEQKEYTFNLFNPKQTKELQKFIYSVLEPIDKKCLSELRDQK